MHGSGIGVGFYDAVADADTNVVTDAVATSPVALWPIILPDVIGVDIIDAGDRRVAASKYDSRLVERQYVLVSIFCAVFRTLSHQPRLVACIYLFCFFLFVFFWEGGGGGGERNAYCVDFA